MIDIWHRAEDRLAYSNDGQVSDERTMDKTDNLNCMTSSGK